MYTVGSMFAGIGGLCKGFENAGADLKWANEFDKYACITYRKNFKHTLFDEDIHKLTTKERIKEIPKVDIITSGFPCQAFSIAGDRKGFDDPRGNLFFETAKVIDKIKPKAFMLENVKNLVGHNNGNTFEVIKNVIVNDLKYSFIPFILNSKDFGNIPQTRERIYIVGFKDEAQYNNFDDKFYVYNIQNDEIYRELIKKHNGQKNSTMNFVIPNPTKLTKKINDLILDEKQDSRFYYDSNNYLYNELSNGVSSRNTIYQWRRVYIRENKSNLCPTLTANMGTGGHNVPIIKDEFGIRKLTPRECARFQGLDDTFILPEIAQSHLYKQIGNSVVMPVVKRIAQEIIRVLNIKY
ncbi:MAG: DNA (cytosine-5-)-methyltransferase [Lutisporaceae bacterium]